MGFKNYFDACPTIPFNILVFFFSYHQADIINERITSVYIAILTGVERRKQAISGTYICIVSE